jgi:calcineurin-like phosphoesterase family protein
MWKHLFNLNPPVRAINVGVDVWDFYPVSYEQILIILKENGVKI